MRKGLGFSALGGGISECCVYLVKAYSNSEGIFIPEKATTLLWFILAALLLR